MSKRVFVTGIGIISAIGNNLSETIDSIYAKKSGIAPIAYLETNHKGLIPVAEVKLSNDGLKELAGIEKTMNYTRTALLGMIAAKQAMQSAGINDLTNFKTGLISSTSVGGMDRSEVFYKEFHQDNSKGKLRDVVGHDCGDSTEKIADYLGIKDYVTTISTACSSAANAMMYGARLIKHGLLDRVVVGGTDSLTRFTLNGFNTLMILDKDGCRPFDETRNGLTIGEGAGYLVLESEEVIKKSGKIPFCELKGYGNANDAYHQTASSPDGYGPYLSMQKAIELSGLQLEEIDYINVHGTGTPNNDLSEGLAMVKAFNGKVPKFSSTKPFTGHTLGAAGGIEAVISILAMKHNIIIPNMNFTTPMKEFNLIPETELITNFEIRNILSNSFGFGGNDSTVIFSKC